MTNTEKLKRKIHTMGYRLDFVASQCGLTYQSFYNKINGRTEFTADEIGKLIVLLKLTAEEVIEIFFAKIVDK